MWWKKYKVPTDFSGPPRFEIWNLIEDAESGSVGDVDEINSGPEIVPERTWNASYWKGGGDGDEEEDGDIQDEEKKLTTSPQVRVD